MTVLIVYSTTEGQTHLIAERMAAFASEAGWEARLTPVESAWRHSFYPSADAVIVAASIHVGKHSPDVVEFVAANRDRLESMPSAFVSVSLSADARKLIAEAYVADFLTQTGWAPAVTGTVAGALRYSQYGMFKRLIVKRVAGKEGLPTDVSRDYEFTNWEDVRRLTIDLLQKASETSIEYDSPNCSVAWR